MHNNDEFPQQTTLLELVEAVSDSVTTDREMAVVIGGLLARRRFLIAGDAAGFQRRVASLKPH